MKLFFARPIGHLYPAGKTVCICSILSCTTLTATPLDGVVHFELEIDYPFIKNVIDYMEAECNRHGIRFVRIKPRKTWDELSKTALTRM